MVFRAADAEQVNDWIRSPVLLFALGTTGRELVIDTGLYAQLRKAYGDARLGLLVADIDRRAFIGLSPGEILPLTVPDDINNIMADGRAKDPDYDHIVPYAFTNHTYSSGTDGARGSSPKDGHSAAAAAYDTLSTRLRETLIGLANVTKGDAIFIRVTVICVGFAGGGTFNGGATVALRALLRGQMEVRRVFISALPSQFDQLRDRKIARSLALLSSLAALERSPNGANVAGGSTSDPLRRPLFEEAHLFGELPSQRGVAGDAATERAYIAEVIRAHLDVRTASSIGVRVLSWRRAFKRKRTPVMSLRSKRKRTPVMGPSILPSTELLALPNCCLSENKPRYYSVR